MSKIEKLKNRLLSKPSDFTFTELKSLLQHYDYTLLQGDGSRVCFYKSTHKIKLHQPHPKNILKKYQVELIIEELKKLNIL
jgi:hypothetical protein